MVNYNQKAHQDENYGLFIANNYVLSEVSKIASAEVALRQSSWPLTTMAFILTTDVNLQ